MLLEPPPAPPADRVDRALRWAYWIFAGSIAFSLAGSLLLTVFPGLMGVFGPVYPQLVKAPTWTYMTLLALLPVLMYVRGLGPAAMGVFFLWGSLVGGMSELVGTQTGFPFGAYQYTDWLGPKLLGHVPYFIPPSWFALSIISHDLAQRVVRRRYERVLVASLFMVIWDVSLDPAMSRAFPFWVYPGGEGFYFGMPASNWAGWFLVSAVIILGYEWLGGGPPAPSPWAPRVYLLNCLFPLGICLIYGLPVAFVIGALATAVPLLAVRAQRPGGASPPRSAPPWTSEAP